MANLGYQVIATYSADTAFQWVDQSLWPGIAANWWAALPAPAKGVFTLEPTVKLGVINDGISPIIRVSMKTTEGLTMAWVTALAVFDADVQNIAVLATLVSFDTGGSVSYEGLPMEAWGTDGVIPPGP